MPQSGLQNWWRGQFAPPPKPTPTTAICPCASCFNASDLRGNFADETPAKDRNRIAKQLANGRLGKKGLALRRSQHSLASDVVPLWADTQAEPRVSSDPLA
ncbi:hypothetical protein DL769_001167 [Monosporascus sp. CRB-8-3]|nr:hypothetical protein DL769_001167 [Monosporascus sp. CRB-8-3]